MGYYDCYLSLFVRDVSERVPVGHGVRFLWETAPQWTLTSSHDQLTNIDCLPMLCNLLVIIMFRQIQSLVEMKMLRTKVEVYCYFST